MSDTTSNKPEDIKIEAGQPIQDTGHPPTQATAGKTPTNNDDDDGGYDKFIKEVFISGEKKEAAAKNISTGTPLITIKEDKTNGVHHSQDETNDAGSGNGGGG